MLAVSTVQGHAARALEFYHNTDAYFSIGKTTEWSPEDEVANANVLTNDNNPPDPSPEEDVLDVVGFKTVESKFLVYPSPDGELTFNGLKWKIVTNPDDAIKLGARWVYLSSWLSYSELPTDISYRQIGVFSSLKRLPDINPSKSSLLPNEVEDRGVLEIIYNRTPVYRMSTQRECLIAVVEF